MLIIFNEEQKKRLNNEKNEVINKLIQAKEKAYKAIQELKQKGEKITVRKVKELAKISINSASKYIKMAKEEGLI